METPPLDPFTIAVALAAAMVGPKLAPYVGAYTLILMGWFAGVLIGIYRRDVGSRIGTGAFVVVSFILTIGSTVATAETLSPHLGVSITYLLIPVAVLIPAVGDTWFDVARWLWDNAKLRLARIWGTQP